jgi:holin-like protein
VLTAFTRILLCQLAGEVLSRGLGLPVPGPVLGMALLFGFLRLQGGPDPELEQTGGALLRHLPILFVPAGVGVMLILPVLQGEWLPIVVATVASTGIAIAVTAWLAQFLFRVGNKEGDHE